MLKIYGTLRCPDCVECKADLDRAGVEYTFLDFDTDLKLLKELLKLFFLNLYQLKLLVLQLL